ncbi:MAG: hypothetical protein ACYC6N_02160 [Pirellulaceae bacterium]
MEARNSHIFGNALKQSDLVFRPLVDGEGANTILKDVPAVSAGGAVLDKPRQVDAQEPECHDGNRQQGDGNKSSLSLPDTARIHSRFPSHVVESDFATGTINPSISSTRGIRLGSVPPLAFILPSHDQRANCPSAKKLIGQVTTGRTVSVRQSQNTSRMGAGCERVATD